MFLYVFPMFSYVLPWTSRRVERRKVYLHRQDLKDGKELLVEGEMAPLPCSFLFLFVPCAAETEKPPVRTSSTVSPFANQ